MEDFVLTADNYYSLNADNKYMSFHQYLNFMGGMVVQGCEAKAMAMLRGEYKEETTTAMLVGSYVDSYFEGTLDKFTAEHPECFTQKGELKASFKQAEKMIKRCEKDEYFMSTLAEWKIKMDSYLPGKAIVDLKTSADIHRAWKVQDYGYVSFLEAYNYTKQLAVYQKIVEINTGKKLPCYISVVTKEDSPEIEVINIDQMTLDHALNEIEMNMASVLMVKSGEVEPVRCEKCDYCKATKVLTKAISYMDLINE